MNKRETLVHAIVWDIVERPIRSGKPTKKYINECALRGLPLPHAQVKIEAVGVGDAWNRLESLYNAKLKNAQVQWPMQVNDGKQREN